MHVLNEQTTKDNEQRANRRNNWLLIFFPNLDARRPSVGSAILCLTANAKEEWRVDDTAWVNDE